MALTCTPWPLLCTTLSPTTTSSAYTASTAPVEETRNMAWLLERVIPRPVVVEMRR